ncbi:MAG: ketopantoate reductase family protein [Candidatus Omnitrophica bacterium]|nr:ketopantoate reductase family protein [Candidatus Omnitrophota bacterium]
MKIAVIGAGAIGGLVAAYLKQKGKDVCLIGRADQVEAIKNGGLKVSGARGDLRIDLDAGTRLGSRADLIILATKTQDIEEAYSQNKDYFRDTTVLTTQNGVKADEIISGFIGRDNIISSIVMFGATYLKAGAIVHNFEGKWIVGKPYGANGTIVQTITDELSSAFEIVQSSDIVAQKWTKLFVNLNNCVPALCGLSMQEVFSDIEMCKLALALQKEAFEAVDRAGIKPGALPGFDIDKARGLAFMPVDKAAAIFSGIMTKLSSEPLHGSILQSIKRGRPSEIDYINGQIADVAEKTGVPAPLNKKLVELVHRVEKTGGFLTKEQIKEKIWKAG